MCAETEFTPLDEIDRAILQLIQRDARNYTAVDIAEHLDVSDGTVRNRIQKLEDRGVIEGYAPLIHYENAGYQLQVRYTCTAPLVERDRLAREALDAYGVVQVRELMTAQGNVEVTAVAPSNDDVNDIALALDELGLTVEAEELVHRRYLRPFNHFGRDDLQTDDDATHDDATHDDVPQDEATHDL